MAAAEAGLFTSVRAAAATATPASAASPPAPAAASPAEYRNLIMATTVDDQAAPLLDLVDLIEKFPDLFDREVLERVDPTDRAFFAQVSHGCQAVVLASKLPCAGTRVGMRESNPEDRAQLAGEVRAYWPRSDLFEHPELGALGSLAYVACSNVPRAGRVVRLELREFCTSAERLAWAKASGCRWNQRTCELAAQGGHLEALRWAREHGCPWSTRVCSYAVAPGSAAVGAGAWVPVDGFELVFLRR